MTMSGGGKKDIMDINKVSGMMGEKTGKAHFTLFIFNIFFVCFVLFSYEVHFPELFLSCNFSV